MSLFIAVTAGAPSKWQINKAPCTAEVSDGLESK